MSPASVPGRVEQGGGMLGQFMMRLMLVVGFPLVKSLMLCKFVRLSEICADPTVGCTHWRGCVSGAGRIARNM